MNILTIIGARPQFIKAAAVSRAILKQPGITEKIIHTGQHFDHNMSEIFFREMNIPVPHINLEINSLSHGAMTGRMLEKLEEVMIEEEPDWVLVYGDTNSTLAGALAACKLHIKVAHVEAGLRSFNRKMPEEINRILTDEIADLLFCPTETAVRNLEDENTDASKLHWTGDVMYDAALYYARQSQPVSGEIKQILEKPYLLCTIHRQENTDTPERLQSIVGALNELHKKYTVVCPLHPRTKIKLEQQGFNLDFKVIEPVGYLVMTRLIKHADLVITDSGGLQKEAFFFKKRCVTMRDETEWVELVKGGFNVLAGANKEKIKQETEKMLQNKEPFDKYFYGKGNASEKIVALLQQ